MALAGLMTHFIFKPLVISCHYQLALECSGMLEISLTPETLRWGPVSNDDVMDENFLRNTEHICYLDGNLYAYTFNLIAL